MEIAEFRAGLHAWLDAHHEEVAPPFDPPGTLDQRIAQMQRVKGILYEAGWMRWGWPERVGGLGGSPLLRTELGAAMAARNLADPGVYSLVEVLAPTLIEYADPALATDWVPRLLSGEEMWCQGFSEPGTGSDLATLSCRAVPDGGDPETAETWVINGQKVWTSLAQYSQRCVLLTRTGTPESRHRGITAFFLDLDTPGITISPIEMINGEREFTEVFFDDVVVPADRILGSVNGGWAVAMSILPYERSSCFWQRIAYLYPRVQRLVDAVEEGDDRVAEAVGNAFLALHTVRSRSRATQHRLAAGATLGADTSIDKVLVATAEQTLYDAVRKCMPGVTELDDTAVGDIARIEYLYSRAATIYGGTAEVQRNIIARRLLELGEEGVMDAAERALLDETVRNAITAAAVAGGPVDAVLTELGWLEMLEAEPRDAVEIVFAALGAANAPAGVLDDVLATALGVAPRADLAVVLPAFGGWSAPAEIGGAEVRVDGLATGRVATVTEVLVVGADALATVPVAAVAPTPVQGVDPAGGWHRVRTVVADAPTASLPDGAWDATVAAGRRAVGHQVAGANRAMLDLARAHVLDRVQFGRPIASFQAVRHKLAETLVAIEGLEATLGAAWDDGTPITSALAKAAAGRTARTVATHCQQVLAGIGFTTDHPFHLYLKRTMVLEGLFGTADAIVLDVGRHLVRTRSAPTLIEL